MLRASEHLLQTADQKRRFELYLKSFQHRGIDLPAEHQEQLKALNKQISEVGEQFQHHVVDEQSAFLLHFADEASFEEMPQDLLAQMKALAGEQ